MVQLTRRHAIGGTAAALAGAAIGPAAGAAAASTGLFDDVMGVVERRTGVSRASILSASRERIVVSARQRAIYVYRLLSSHGYSEIGRRFGGRDHMPVIYACRKIERLSVKDPAAFKELDDLIQACIVEAVRNGHRLRPAFDRSEFQREPIAFDPDNLTMPPCHV